MSKKINSRYLRILLVTDGFYPEISPRSFRATELACEFARNGHFVQVISKFQEADYKSFSAEYNLGIRLLDKKKLKTIVPKKGITGWPSRILSRTLSLLFEYPGIETLFQVKRALKEESGYDILVSIAVPHPNHWGVSFVRHKIAQTWIADCGDPYMFARLDRFRKPFYFRFLEERFCKRADFITVPFAEMKNQFYKNYRNKIHVIPQGIDFGKLNLYKGVVKNGIPTFIYAGSVIRGIRDLNVFLKYLSELNRDFKFIVYTNQPEYFYSYADMLGSKLEINGYINREQLIYELSKADFLVNVDTIYDNNKNVEALPSKLIDYGLSGRPVLNIQSDNPDFGAVNRFLNREYSGARKIEIERYNIRNVAQAFIDLHLLKNKARN